MSEGQSITYQAPMTWADVFYKGRVYLFILIICVAAFFLFPKDNIMIWRGLGGFIAGTLITYWVIVFRHGLVVDTTNLEHGIIEAYEPQTQELRDLSTRDDAVLLPSKYFGTVLLLGGRFYTGEIFTREIIEGDEIISEELPVATNIKSHLELAMNSMELSKYRAFNQTIIPRWMLLERNLELALQIRQQEELSWFRQILGLEPMRNSDKEASEKLPE